MKKLIYVAVYGILGATVTANAQEAGYAFNSAPEKNFVASASNSSAAINEKAVKSFSRSFPGKTDVNWYAIKDGYVAHFSSPQVTRIYYDRKGNWRFTRKDYSPAAMPAGIRQSVKTAFPEYAMFGAEEISAPGGLVYLVHLEGMFSWRTVRVTDDDMDVIETLEK